MSQQSVTTRPVSESTRVMKMALYPLPTGGFAVGEESLLRSSALSTAVLVAGHLSRGSS